jgi:hypothetical protein
MVRKSTLAFGILFSAWFVIDVAATNAEACGGCRQRSCGSSCCAAPCYAPPVCSPCGSGCGSCGSSCGLFRSRCGGLFGSGCNTCSAAPVCTSGCVAGYAVPGSYSYAMQVAPNYGPAFVLTRVGVPSMRTSTVFRTSYAAPLR